MAQRGKRDPIDRIPDQAATAAFSDRLLRGVQGRQFGRARRVHSRAEACDDFGIALVTIDGHVYEVRDSAVRPAHAQPQSRRSQQRHGRPGFEETCAIWAASFADYRRLHPETALKIMRNVAAILARRLMLANAKVDLLSVY
nr:hypothetical protein [Bradyrhizobium sp. 149]